MEEYTYSEHFTKGRLQHYPPRNNSRNTEDGKKKLQDQTEE